MTIHLLSDEVASQIAAGEVIERPASAVKELLENALDAGADQIQITIEGAGKQLIEVADNGSGIPAGELALAVSRHATSKLRTAEDLFQINTLGFRGEALSSIGSVSRLTITSRPTQAELGARLRVDGGHVYALEQVGAPAGTLARVESLFYSVPARLKFLKQDNTERQAIDALVTRYALAYPKVRLRMTLEGKPGLQTSGNGSRREILSALYGVDTARQMLEVTFADNDIHVSGYISPVSLTRSNRREITFFVNGRWVQDVPLMTALLQAYHTLLMVGRYPLAVLLIDLSPESIDVNVHPAKAEVRFHHPDLIFSSVQRAIRRALLAATPVPGLYLEPRWGSGAQQTGVDPAWAMSAEINARPWPPPVALVDGAPETGVPQNGGSVYDQGVNLGQIAGQAPGLQPDLQVHRLPLLRLLGQVGTTYLVAEGPDGLYLIDQHAAHERVLFERFMASARATAGRSLPAQTLLEPAAITLTPNAAGLLNAQLPALERWGFHVEPFGPNTFLVRAIPAIILGSDPAAALRVLVEDFEEDETPLQSEIEAKMIARICKRVAVKAGQVLSLEEQRALLTDLEACVSPRTCPHGRPTMIHLPADLLERQFGRRGAR
ncbi:MAG TPA: DNA mismatch repair endonuclease MutL [Anaerolineaceae bacterium]